MNETDEQVQRDDDVRLEAALLTIKDIMWRFEEVSEGRRSAYEIVGCLIEDLVREGLCPACISESVANIFQGMGVDPTVHIEDQGSTYH